MKVYKSKNSSWRYILFILCCCFPFILSAQTTKKYPQPSEQITHFNDLLENVKKMYQVTKQNTNLNRSHSVMLPKTPSNHTSPLFCRLEAKINEGNNLQCLFRLGSVSYVNYLEQKGDHQRLMLEQMRQ